MTVDRRRTGRDPAPPWRAGNAPAPPRNPDYPSRSASPAGRVQGCENRATRFPPALPMVPPAARFCNVRARRSPAAHNSEPDRSRRARPARRKGLREKSASLIGARRFSIGVLARGGASNAHDIAFAQGFGRIVDDPVLRGKPRGDSDLRAKVLRAMTTVLNRTRFSASSVATRVPCSPIDRALEAMRNWVGSTGNSPAPDSPVSRGSRPQALAVAGSQLRRACDV